MAAPMTERAIARIRQLIIDGKLIRGQPASRRSTSWPRWSGRPGTPPGKRSARWSPPACWTSAAATAPSSPACARSCCWTASGRRCDLVQDDSYLELLEVRRVLETGGQRARRPADRRGRAGRAAAAQLELMRQARRRRAVRASRRRRSTTSCSAAAGNATMAALLSGIASRTLRDRVRRLIDSRRRARGPCDEHHRDPGRHRRRRPGAGPGGGHACTSPTPRRRCGGMFAERARTPVAS